MLEDCLERAVVEIFYDLVLRLLLVRERLLEYLHLHVLVEVQYLMFDMRHILTDRRIEIVGHLKSGFTVLFHGGSLVVGYCLHIVRWVRCRS